MLRVVIVVGTLAAIAVGATLALGGSAVDKHGARVVRFTVHSRYVHQPLPVVAVVPAGASAGPRPLLVFLHGKGEDQNSNLGDSMFAALARLGPNAPDVVFPYGGDDSYWHDRADGAWGRYVMNEVIRQAVLRLGADPHRVAIGGISMGGFGALDLARLAPHRFCAVGAHSAAMWFSGGDTPAGAFDDAADFTRNDLVALARSRSPNRASVWIDVGRNDPFRQADTVLAHELEADGARVTFHVWPGGHNSHYWHRHIARYLRFYAEACAA